MSPTETAPAAARRRPLLAALAPSRLRAIDARALARRLAHFWVVWSLLLLVHEGGHALAGARQGLEVSRVTVGVGPVLWRGELGGTETVLRLVPIAGITSLSEEAGEVGGATGWSAWGRHVVTLAGGVGATLALAIAMAGLVAVRERGSGRRWRWGRIVVADAIVLTVFNFLPVPPLDGGRAVIEGVAAWRGAPLHPEALFWVQIGGLALAIVPMALWTRWTARIDALAMRLGAPRGEPGSARGPARGSA